MSCGCGSCMFVEYGGGATGVDSTEHDTGDAAPLIPPRPLCGWCESLPTLVIDTMRFPAGCPNCGNSKTPADWHIAPAPLAPAETRMGALAALDRRAGPGADEAPAPEATGEMLWLCEGCGKVQTRSPEGGGHFTPPDDHCGPVVPLAEGVAALRTRAREAEEREAKWRRELSAACELSERAREIVVSALNQPPEHFYDKHDNGEWSAEHAAFAIRSLFRERDEAREQRDAIRKHSSAEIGRLGLEVARLRDDFAAAIARAEEMTHAHATERAARLKAEAERDAAKAPFVYCPECDSRKVAIDSDGCCATCGTEALVTDVVARLRNDHQRLAAAEAEVKRLTIAPCPICAGFAHPSGLACACGGTNSAYKALDYVLGENAALRARAQRLVEAGDAMVKECYDWPGLVSRWLAAKAGAAAKEGK